MNLAVTSSTVTLTVTDNGCGLPADYLAGVGHRSMRERSSELGGALAIDDAPGGGTRVAVTFALEPA